MNVSTSKAMTVCNEYDCLACFGLCFEPSDLAFVQPITVCFGNYVGETLGLQFFSAVDSLTVQFLRNIYGMHLCAMAFGNLIST